MTAETVRAFLRPAITTELADIVTKDVAVLGEPVEDHDPLGLAFYLWAAMESSWRTDAIDDLGIISHSWVQEKLHSKELSIHADRDIAAIGLFAYTLSKHGIAKFASAEYAAVVLSNFKEDNGIFGRFFTTTLAALGIQAIDPTNPESKKLGGFIIRKIQTESAIILNDLKNLLVAYLWCKEVNDNQILHQLIKEAELRAWQQYLPNTERTYALFVLLSEIHRFGRLERSRIASACEEVVERLRLGLGDFAAPGDVIQVYEEDVFCQPGESERPNYQQKPRMSRIVVAVTMAIAHLQHRHRRSLLSSEGFKEATAMGALIIFSSFMALGLICVALRKAGLPFHLLQLFNEHPFAFAPALIANSAAVALVVTILAWMFLWVWHVFVRGQEPSLLLIFRETIHLLKEWWWASIVLGIVTGFFT